LNLMKPLDFLENHYVKNAFKKATHIIVQNKWQEVELQSKHHRKSIYLKQAAPIERNNSPQKNNNLLRIVWIANMKSIKRPELFIELAKQFREKNDIKFEMIGRLDSKYSKQISGEEKQNPMFRYLGELTNSEVNDLLLETDILINTSDYEG